MLRGSLCAVMMMLAMGSYSAEQYAADVVSGKQVACKYVKLAVERHFNDLDRQGTAEFPYVFEPKQAERIIDFKRELRHYIGPLAGQRYNPAPWQQFKDWVLFGWRRMDGLRRFKKAYIEVARKSGKTFDAGGTANYCLYADSPKENGAKIYCVATNKEQAQEAFNAITAQIKAQPVLAKRSRLWRGGMKGGYRNVTLHTDQAASATIWSQDSGTKDGFNPSFALCDEMHAWPDSRMLEVIASGNIARRQPLVYIITTAGLDINVPCYQEERTLAVATLERTIEPVPENLFAIIYTLDEGDDFTNPAVWEKANPSIGVSFGEEELAERVQDALNTPSKMNAILTKNFNIWTHAQTRWIAPEKWRACDGAADVPDGATCYGGLDLSQSIDLTAYSLVFPGDVSRYLWRIFIPEADLAERIKRDRVPYDIWIRDGWIITTPGSVVNHDIVEGYIRADAECYQIEQMAYDPWAADMVVQHLMADGMTMVKVRQGYGDMSAPMKEFEKQVLSKSMAHGGNPVAAWMLSCVEAKTDRQGNVCPMKPTRNRAGKRIDGIVAAIMATGLAMRHDSSVSVYEERGAIIV